MKILLATLNIGKRRELASLLSGLEREILTLADLPPLPECSEDGGSFLENALKKCRHYYALTGLPTLADDSGLEIDALNGQPGIHSARFAGPGASDEERIEKVLGLMREVADQARQARFVCALAYRWDRDQERTFLASAEGIITHEPAGSGGFGYDPIFRVPQLGRTFAELTPEEKGRISHRGKALARFRDFLASQS